MGDAEYIDSILAPHHSLLTSDMVIACARWYAPEHLQKRFMAVYLSVCACETSLADPKLGGRLVTEAFNFGCITYGSPNTPWGQIGKGAIIVGGRKWWRWGSAWEGAAALGRLLKTGPGRQPGFYLRCIENEDFGALTGTYYGKSVEGYATYHKRWMRFYQVFSRKLTGR